MFGIVSAILAIIYVLLVHIGFAAFAVSAIVSIASMRMRINVTYPRIVLGILGGSISAFLIWIYINQPYDYDYPGLYFMLGPTFFSLIIVSLIDFLIKLVSSGASSEEWVFLLCNLILSFTGGWGMGQIVDWIRRK